MASRPHLDGRAPALPLDMALSVIPSLPRALLARLVERAIEELDTRDGDPDLEANGDELDGSSAEDDIGNHAQPWGQPGCPISDPSEDEHDAEQDNDGDCGEHGIDQRIAATVHSFTPWHIDRERHT